MKRVFNVFIGGVMSMCFFLCVCCDITYASAVGPIKTDESTITRIQDDIQFEKSACWTTYKGQRYDECNKPYAKINFNVKRDISSIDETDILQTEGTIDVMLVLDCSGSMEKDNKKERLKESATHFINNYLDDNATNRRLGIVAFSCTADVYSDLQSDKEELLQAVQYVYANAVTNLQDGIWQAQRILEKSTADNKVMVIISDGYPTVDLASYTDLPLNEDLHVADGADFSESTINQIEMAKKYVDNLKIMTIGIGTNDDEDSLLEDIASTNPDTNETYYYKDENLNFDSIRLKEIFNEIYNNIVVCKSETISYVKIVDQLPEGVEYITYDGLKSDNESLFYNEESRIINYIYDEKLDQIDLDFSILVKIDTSVLDDDYWSKTNYINTNGKSMDIFVDSQDSAVFEYKYVVENDLTRIGIISPKLEKNPIILDLIPEITKEPLRVPIAEPEQEEIPESTSEPEQKETLEPTMKPTLKPTGEEHDIYKKEPIVLVTPEPTQKPEQEETPEVTQEPISEVTQEPITEVTQEPTPEATQEATSESTLMPTSEPVDEVVNIEENDIPLSDKSDKTIITETAPQSIDEELDNTPKTGYKDDLNINEVYKTPYLVKDTEVKDMKKGAMKFAILILAVVGILVLFFNGLLKNNNMDE